MKIGPGGPNFMGGPKFYDTGMPSGWDDSDSSKRLKSALSSLSDGEAEGDRSIDCINLAAADLGNFPLEALRRLTGFPTRPLGLKAVVDECPYSSAEPFRLPRDRGLLGGTTFDLGIAVFY